MKTIKYEIDSMGVCSTRCPFSKNSSYKWPIFVGSTGCLECEHYVGENEVNKTIICNADKEIE